ncbi:MAG: hypothetical protein SFW67_36685 [Myxococcaceae bacterium]|nr:hypothetical protein [Myxococcaceae bacterium]
MTGAVLVGALGVPLILEASHGLQVVSKREAGPAVSIGGAPVPGGAVGVVTARF